MQRLPFHLFSVCLAAFAASSAMAQAKNESQKPSRIAPEASFSHFWSGFSFGLGLTSEKLSGENSSLYKPYQPGIQLTMLQHIRSVFSGSISARTAYWKQNAEGTNSNQTVIPFTVTTRVEITPPLGSLLPEFLSASFFPYAFAGPGGIFFPSNSERELPGRSYVLEAGAGISLLTSQRTSLRIAYRYWKSASSLNLKGNGASVELHIGDFTNIVPRQ
jgi:hypothetical protein